MEDGEEHDDEEEEEEEEGSMDGKRALKSLSVSEAAAVIFKGMEECGQLTSRIKVA
jgi:hypothetical protein